jgi:type IV secretion system protein VirB9
MRSLTIATAIACALTGPAWALQEATPGKLDPRMVTAVYNPSQVFAVHVPQGQTLAITLSPNEIATDAFGGDKDSLRADPNGNVVMFWTGANPVAPRTIFIRSRTVDGTNKTRTYSLLVDSRPPEQADIGFTFTYPDEEAAERAEKLKKILADKAAEKKAQEDQAAHAALEAANLQQDTNYRFVLQGKGTADWNLLPTREVSDNSTDTHFRFPGSMRVPIIYALNPDGKEAVADYTFNSQTGVATVHQLARVFHLRDGDALLCIFNKGFDPVGVRSQTGTVSPDVERATQ